MLIASRRVGEAFNIYAPDTETVICALFVAKVRNLHASDSDVENATNELCAELVIQPEMFDLKRFGVTDTSNRSFVVQVGNKWNLYDKDLKNVIAEIVAVEIKTHAKDHRFHDENIKSEFHSRVFLGFNFDTTKCLIFAQTSR